MIKILDDIFNSIGTIALLVVGIPMGTILIYNGFMVIFLSDEFQRKTDILEYFKFSNLLVLGISLLVILILISPFAANYFKERKINESVRKNSVFIKVPTELKTSIQQYLLFFKEYVQTAKNRSIKFDIIQSEDGLVIQTSKLKKEERNIINKWFNEYIDLASQSSPISIIKEGKVSNKEMKFLRLKLDTQISNLKSSLKIAYMENKLLRENNEFLKTLTLNFSQNRTTIYNQHIKDGNQQFADKIENK